MATTNLGRIGFVAKGDYAAGTYKYLDLVRYSGAAYVCKIASTTALPTDTSAWDLLLQDTGALDSGSPTNITGIIKGAAGALSAATAGTDYQLPITGGATTIATSNLTASKALVSDASGKVAASTATSTEIGYLSGVTSAIQTQIGTKQATLVNTTNIKSINGNSLLGSGNLAITASGLNAGAVTNITGLFYGAAGSVLAATAGTHYQAPVLATTSLLKGNGSLGGITTATAGTDYAGISTANSFTSDQIINGVKVGKGYGNVSSNTAVGAANPLGANTTGYGNTAVGAANPLGANTTGYGNTAVGAGTLTVAMANYNTAVGGYALGYATSGSNNTAVGYFALNGTTTGSGNTSINPLTSAGSNSPAYLIVTENNRISMGSTSVTNAYVQVAWTVVSDARDKTNFSPVPHGLDFVNQLNPISYQFKENRDTDITNGGVRYGFKAQDILALEGENPVVIDNESPEKLRYVSDHLIPILVKAVQELSARVVELENAR